MNRQKLVDERSRAYHTKIAAKLREDSQLWNIPVRNIRQWKKNMGELPPALSEWERILSTLSPEEILDILERDSEESARLRSSSPFTGILSDAERDHILQAFRQAA